jgi:hypothetical protein
MPDYINFIYEELPGIKGITLCGLDYCGTTKEQNLEIAVKFSEMKPYIEKSLENAIEKNFKIPVCVTDIPLCTINYKYWKYFSCTSKYRKNSAYSSPEIKKTENLRLQFNTSNQCGTFSEKCKACDIEPHCSGTWRATWDVLGNSEILPIKIKHRSA